MMINGLMIFLMVYMFVFSTCARVFHMVYRQVSEEEGKELAKAHVVKKTSQWWSTHHINLSTQCNIYIYTWYILFYVNIMSI